MTYSQTAFLLLCIGWPAFWVLVTVGIYEHWWARAFTSVTIWARSRRK